jgi:hypothetical protein
MSCYLHKTHQPAHATSEEHHVIPRAWQHFWRPDGSGTMRLYPDNPVTQRQIAMGWAAAAAELPLWDPRTVTCCPTGHRNVHFWIVAVMKDLPASLLDEPRSHSAQRAALLLSSTRVRAYARNKGWTVSPADFSCAMLAPERFVDTGGDLADLLRAKMYGEA